MNKIGFLGLVIGTILVGDIQATEGVTDNYTVGLIKKYNLDNVLLRRDEVAKLAEMLRQVQ